MAFLPLAIPPGMVRNGTAYQAKGRWIDGNLVRWHNGVMQAIGPVFAEQDAPSAVASQLVVFDVGVNDTAWAFLCGTTIYAHGGGVGGGSISMNPAGQSPAWRNMAVFDTETQRYLVAIGGTTLHSWDSNWLNKLAVVAVPQGATYTVPSAARVCVTPERFLFLLQADDKAARVAWPNQETINEFDFSNENSTAGFFDLPTVGTVVAGRPMRNETLLWTNNELWSARYIGQPLIYSFTRLGSACGTIGEEAMAVADSRAFWMGPNSFFMYDGYVRPLPSDVADYVFGRLDRSKVAKIRAVTVAQFNEVWWFYSAGSSENDSAVVYNYAENFWYTCAFGRSCGIDRGVVGAPLMGLTTGGAVYHEYPGGGAIGTPWIESGPVELDAGNNVMMVRKYIPDENTLGQTSVTFKTRFSPTSTETTVTPSVAAASFQDVRFTARQVRLRVTQVAAGWRFGTPRLDVVPCGER